MIKRMIHSGKVAFTEKNSCPNNPAANQMVPEKRANTVTACIIITIRCTLQAIYLTTVPPEVQPGRMAVSMTSHRMRNNNKAVLIRKDIVVSSNSMAG